MSRKITAIIVDDEQHAIKRIEDLADGIERLEIVDTFTDPMKGLKSLRTQHVDLVLLDVEMEPITGLQFLVQLPEEIKVVLVSGYDKYAIDGYQHKVSDFLQKPVSFDRLVMAVCRVGDELDIDSKNTSGSVKGHHFFLIKGPTRYVRTKIDFKDIRYIETVGGRLLVYLQQRKEPFVSKSELKKIMLALPPDWFMQIHRSFIINIDYLDTCNNRQAIMKNPATILPVGKKENYPEFFKWKEQYSA